MSELAEALVAAQRRALSAMEKQYVAGKLDGDEARTIMDAIGLTDDVDQDRLLFALAAIRQYGVPLPAEPSNGAPAEKKPEPASAAQLAFIAKLAKDKQVTPPEQPLTKLDAHEIIDTLQAGTYDEAQWTVPF